MNGPWKALASLWLLCATVTAAAAEPGFYAGVGLARTFQDMGDSNGIVLAIDSPLQLAGTSSRVCQYRLRGVLETLG